MKRILVPTDFSEHANWATQLALNLAPTLDAEIYFLHGIESLFQREHVHALTTASHVLPSDAYQLENDQLQQNFSKATELLNAQIEEAQTLGIKTSPHIESHFTTRSIIDFAKEKAIDLIIMGSHGVSGLSETLIGSNTQQVARHAKCPVLTVRSAPQDFALQEILFASDFSATEAAANIETVRVLAEAFGARINLLFINTPHHFEETKHSVKKLEQFAKAHQLTNYSINLYSHYAPEFGIHAFTEQAKTDVLAISIHGHNGLARLLDANVSEYLINRATVPVLTLPLN